jgi:uncharacterized protein
MEPEDMERKRLLEQSRVIAIVGLSPDAEKASNVVANYLLKAGYTVIPVNPTYDEIMGRKSYKNLLDIPGQVDIVDIFMRAERVVPIVQEAIKLKPKAIWLQLGIVNDEAKRIAENAAITFVQDLCVKQEHARLFQGNE